MARQLVDSLIEDCSDELSYLDSDQEEEIDAVLDNVSYNLDIVPMFQFSYMTKKFQKLCHGTKETFPDYDDKRFRKLVRCSRLQFKTILKEIRGHENFNGSKNSNKHFTVEFQLCLVLYRLGSNGDGATIQKISCLFGVGDGGTIGKITARVFDAILSVEPKYLIWPNSDERKTLVERTMHELPYCVGYTDGTEIQLVEAPKIDRDVYLSRNKVFGLKLQTTIDYTKLVRHITVGYSGSVHEARIYNNCDLALNPSKYLTEPPWIGSDSAYKLRTTMIPPFRKNAKELTPTARRDLNRYFITYRVRVKHMIGIMKGKMSSCKMLPARITDAKSNEFACTWSWIITCCILHNILLSFYDEEDLQYAGNGNIGDESDEDDTGEFDNDDNDARQNRIALYEVISEQNM